MSLKIIIRKVNTQTGELGAGTRRIAITGTATLQSTLTSVESLESYLRGQFAAQGWNLINFNFTKTGFFTVTFNIEITADVPNAYSNQSHLDEAYRIFNNYTVNYLIGSTRAITDVNLRISGADKAGANPVQYVNPIYTQVNKNPSGANASAGNLPSSFPDLSALNPQNLFGTAGLSVGLVAAVLIGIIILKR